MHGDMMPFKRPSDSFRNTLCPSLSFANAPSTRIAGYNTTAIHAHAPPSGYGLLFREGTNGLIVHADFDEIAAQETTWRHVVARAGELHSIRRCPIKKQNLSTDTMRTVDKPSG